MVDKVYAVYGEYDLEDTGGYGFEPYLAGRFIHKEHAEALAEHLGGRVEEESVLSDPMILAKRYERQCQVYPVSFRIVKEDGDSERYGARVSTVEVGESEPRVMPIIQEMPTHEPAEVKVSDYTERIPDRGILARPGYIYIRVHGTDKGEVESAYRSAIEDAKGKIKDWKPDEDCVEVNRITEGTRITMHDPTMPPEWRQIIARRPPTPPEKPWFYGNGPL